MTSNWCMCCVFALLVWSSLYSSRNWRNGLDTIAKCILKWYDCVYELDLRAMKHFTYGCFRLANISHCMFHFLPKRICVHVCPKYVAVFSIFNQFHNSICWLCLKNPCGEHQWPQNHFQYRNQYFAVAIQYELYGFLVCVEWNANNEKHALVIAWLVCGVEWMLFTSIKTITNDHN